MFSCDHSFHWTGEIIHAERSVCRHGCTARFGFDLASTIVYQTGFEAPQYNVGNLIGQNNWSQYDADLPFANVTVQSDVVRPGTGGSQAVKFQSTGASSNPYTDFTDVWSTDSAVPSSLIANEPIVRIQWDMMRGTLGANESPTSAWGIDIYDTNATNVAATISVYDDLIGPGVSGTDDQFGPGVPRRREPRAAPGTRTWSS